MTDWYYHDPAQGRVGPLTAEQMRARYRDRRILRDTLAWHRDLPEWQPIERLVEDLELGGVQPDASQPPPMPAATPSHAHARQPGTSQAGSSRTASPARGTESRKGMSGCLIAVIVLAVLAIPVIGILAAIAIPAYQDYTVRARISQIVLGAEPMQAQVDRYIAGLGRCPGNRSRGFERAETYASAFVSGVQVGELADGACAFELRFRGMGAAAEGKTLTFQRGLQTHASAWTCLGGTLPAKYRPDSCRSTTTE
ncbi:MAG: GYF domain-containing protein [Pseudomonadota bacterium]|nr:GYF domain-containing protein [Pseudomonadota bacterium]